MKGGGANGVAATKRRWKGFVIAVMGLVILSMLVPLVFLLGFHNAFHSPHDSDSVALGAYQSHNHTMDQHDETRHIEDLIERLAPALPKERVGKQDHEIFAQDGLNRSMTKAPMHVYQPKGSPGHRVETNVREASPERKNVNISKPIEVRQLAKGDESEIPCELRFGSYCIWRREHKEDMMDSMVKKLKDRLFVARAYFPSIAKLPVHENLSRELKQNIQDFERIFSEASTDADLPPHVEDKLRKMETAIARAKSVPVDCNNVDKKFRQLVDLTEDEANFHTKQSAFLYQLAVQTMPKSLHCLSMRLTVEYFHTSSEVLEDSVTEKYVDPKLYHYVIFSNNILASSVAINSTVESSKLVFHVLTDRQNFYAMKLWFVRNMFKKASIQVLNIEEYNIIPDLSALWRINMGGMVNGAAENCAVRLGQLENYLGRTNFNRNSCAWMSGLNVIDLARWRDLNLTGIFRRMVEELTMKSRQHEATASKASLLTFQDQVYALDDTWVLSGLGHDYGLNLQFIKNFAVLHYNGNMKPWLELGIPKYRIEDLEESFAAMTSNFQHAAATLVMGLLACYILS
uniref:Hexosyltransferase n=1 Tax=Chenopodium quinoa TaxID=63459 RepID=A0A803LXT4_CHEQI